MTEHKPCLFHNRILIESDTTVPRNTRTLKCKKKEVNRTKKIKKGNFYHEKEKETQRKFYESH